MFDFVKINVRDPNGKLQKLEVYPEFLVKKSKDLMVRGKSFYGIWDENNEIWSTDEGFVQDVIDKAVREEVEKQKILHPDVHNIKGLYLGNFSSNKWVEWQKYVKSLPDNYHELDTKIIFANSKPKKTDYASKRLAYEMKPGDYSAYDEIMSTLYSLEERRKLEWAIGAIISGDSKHIQKFIVLKGAPGTGKSTFLNIVQKLFEGYYSFFDAKSLGSSNESFALEAFKNNPLIAIQHDGDLSRIEDNTKLNQIISHESLVVNEKFKATYSSSFNSFLFMGTNTNVRISDAKSGIIRRLISVEPSGNTLPFRKYHQLMNQVDFELGAIANHCYELYLDMGENAYDKYIAYDMIGATNDFFNFVEEMQDKFVDADGNTTLKMAWYWYKNYAEEANVKYPFPKRQFKNELKNYFNEFYERKGDEYSLYEGFLKEKFIQNTKEEPDLMNYKLEFHCKRSDFDEWAKDMQLPAQYANEDGNPMKKWDNVNTTLEDIDTKKLHWVKVPENHIVIDFDLKDESGNKSFEKNLEAASKWPSTYAELSKSGAGIHLHYIYDGDASQLQRLFAPDIEVKVFTGNSALRRKLTKCNNVPIRTINSGLKLKERKDMVPVKQVEDEQHLKNLIAKYIRKEGGLSTSQSTSLILKALDEAYDAGFTYDLSEMESDVDQFARHSSNNKDRCMAMVDKMHFKSKDMERLVDTPDEFDGPPGETDENKPIVFFDIEVFPNVFILCWKYAGEKATVTKMINPKPEDVRILFEKFRMVGFNNRDYDNHICWAYFSGATPYMCYDISQKIIVNKDNSAKSWQAYGLSYTDVFDFASNPNKMGLKKWEIKLGIHHQENSYTWDEDLPEDAWDEVADYCANDVIATEAVFNAIQGDYMARLILAKLSGLTPNDKTNKHSMQIIFGDDQNPQSEFVYTDLSKDFPGYKFDAMAKVKSTYKGYEVGEGGFVWAKEGMYRNVKTFDVASMHPSSLIALNLFGCRYTKRFKELKEARLAIKHEDREALKHLLGGELLPFYDEAVKGTDYTLKDLAGALKTVINSIYGLTAAKFENRCRDPRNVDNIVAKRGALFMVDLLEEVQKRGGEVVHIKTDSIKVANPTPELEQFIIDYGKKWGYDFEVESVYDRICLINKAVYIAMEDGEWTATGAEFDHPYIFKKLFSGEPITIDDMSETKNADKGALYLDYNENLPDVTKLEKEREKLYKKWKNGDYTRDDTEILEDYDIAIAEGHNYKFVGKVSAFLPVKSGVGGGELVVKRDDKYVSASGATGYRWLETEYFKAARKDSDIDMSYYDKLIEGAISDISEFGDFDRFVHDPDYDPQLEKLKDIVNVPDGMDEEVPFDEDTFMNKPVETKGE